MKNQGIHEGLDVTERYIWVYLNMVLRHDNEKKSLDLDRQEVAQESGRGAWYSHTECVDRGQAEESCGGGARPHNRLWFGGSRS